MTSVSERLGRGPLGGDLRFVRGNAAPRRWALSLLLALTEGALVWGVVFGSALAWHDIAYAGAFDGPRMATLAAIIAALFVLVGATNRTYLFSRYLERRSRLSGSVAAWTVTMSVFVTIGFLTRLFDEFSRASVVVAYLVGLPTMMLVRTLMARALATAVKDGRLSALRVMLIGTPPEIDAFVRRHRPWLHGIEVVSTVELADAAGSGEARGANALRLKQAVETARDRKPESVVIALRWSRQTLIEECVDAFMTAPVSIMLAPERILDRFERPRVVSFGPISSLELSSPAISPVQVLLKMAFDVTVAVILLCLLAPLLAIIAIAIRLDSPGPVFFRQRRYGFNQETFRILKFRTMTVAEDGDMIPQATRNDPRITRVGATLRRFNLDELPQLVNVLVGQMSLVGPRPHALAHNRAFEERLALYARRHNVKPGITGWAQVNGFRGETDTDEKMARRLACDHWYIDNWSFWLDISILVRTVTTPRAFMNAV